MRKFIPLLSVFLMLMASPAFALLQVKTGKATVSSAGTAVALSTSDQYYFDITVCANSANTGVVTIGPQNVVGAALTREGVSLYSNACFTFIPQGTNSLNGNVKELYVDSTANGDKINFLYRQAK